MADNNVIAMAAGSTYETVFKYSVHAHPAVPPYPYAKAYLALIRQGGTIEYVYKIISVVECLPEKVYDQKNKLTEDQYKALIGYHEERSKSFGYGKKNTNYRYYILERYGEVLQPFQKKGIRLSVGLNLRDIPLKGDVSGVNNQNDIAEKTMDFQEAVLMVDTYLMIRNGKLTRAYAVEDCVWEMKILSSHLDGEDVSKTLDALTAIFENGQTSTQDSDELKNAVTLYKHQRNEFNRELRGIKDAIYGGNFNDPDDLKMSKSLNETVDYLSSRYDVRIEYNHFVNSLKGWSNDIYYVVSNSVEDIMGIYYVNNRKSHGLGIETELDYIESVFDTLEGFHRKQKARKRHVVFPANLSYTDYDDISDALAVICDAIDDRFSHRTMVSKVMDGMNRHLERNSDLDDSSNEVEIDSTVEGVEREATVNVRVNQDVFREKLIQKYHECCICGVNKVELLVASHIKPWKDSDPEERVDVNNGLLLCANHDRLFDAGFISFKDNGSILVSGEIDMHNRILMNVRPEMRIQVSEKMKEYLAFHRKHVFRESEE